MPYMLMLTCNVWRNPEKYGILSSSSTCSDNYIGFKKSGERGDRHTGGGPSQSARISSASSATGPFIQIVKNQLKSYEFKSKILLDNNNIGCLRGVQLQGGYNVDGARD